MPHSWQTSQLSRYSTPLKKLEGMVEKAITIGCEGLATSKTTEKGKISVDSGSMHLP